MRANRLPMGEHLANFDAFAGTWVLIPELSNYQTGQPPKAATYRIQPGDGDVAYEVEWTTESGEQKSQAFRTRLEDDGEDGAWSALTYPRTLASTVREGGVVVAHARRMLNSDGSRLEVLQIAFHADGSVASQNRSVYQRADADPESASVGG